MNEGTEAKENVKGTAGVVGGGGPSGAVNKCASAPNKNAAVLDNGRKPVPGGG